MLVRVTPLMRTFFLQLLSSFFLCPVCITCLFFSFCLYALNSFGYAFSSSSWGSCPNEELRVQLIDMQPQPLSNVALASSYAPLGFGPLHVWWTHLVGLISLLEFCSQWESLICFRSHTMATCNEMALLEWVPPKALMFGILSVLLLVQSWVLDFANFYGFLHF